MHENHTDQRNERGILSIDGLDLRYCIEGRGEPLLVIGSAIYYPRTFSEALRNRRQLCFIDHRGFAHAQRPVTSDDGEFRVIIEDIERLRVHLGLGQIDILGHSGHGYMALDYARSYPRNTRRVVAVGTGPSHAPQHMARAEQLWRELEAPERKQIFDSDMAELGADLNADPDRRFVHMCIRMGARSWYDPAFDARPLWKDVHVNMPVFDRLWGETFRDIDTSALLRGIHAPILLALGRCDYLVAPAETWDDYRSCARDLTIKLFEQSGHTPQLEQSATFDTALLAFLDSETQP